MRSHWTRRALALSLPCALVAGVAASRVSEEEARRLGQDLTPLGAERAGNADGAIPEWTGGVTRPPPDWKPGGPRVNPFPDDPVLFSIDASNVASYSDKLSPGQIALLEGHEGYRMDVYRTRRSCGYPQWVYDATRKNATTARLDEDQIYLAEGWHPILFPIPANGAEAIWNHQYGFFTEGKIEYNASFAPTRSGDLNPQHVKQIYDTRMFSPNWKSLTQAEGRSASVFREVTGPPSRAGQMVVVHEMLNDQRRAWVYNQGQRRVRRAPTVAYDTPYTGSESLMTNDQALMFNGIIDRYDWKLLGKRELYVPYNVFDLNHRPGLTYAQAFGPLYPDRSLIRYELHRVWVVEATLKEGYRHVLERRVFYLDEDSWKVLVEDIYDRAGNLWRVMEAMLAVIPEVPTCFPEGTLSYDLVARRYAADGVKTEEPTEDWLAGREGRVPGGIFTPDALRRMGKR
jgi:hypothetical protein